MLLLRDNSSDGVRASSCRGSVDPSVTLQHMLPWPKPPVKGYLLDASGFPAIWSHGYHMLPAGADTEVGRHTCSQVLLCRPLVRSTVPPVCQTAGRPAGRIDLPRGCRTLIPRAVFVCGADRLPAEKKTRKVERHDAAAHCKPFDLPLQTCPGAALIRAVGRQVLKQPIVSAADAPAPPTRRSPAGSAWPARGSSTRGNRLRC